MSSKNIFILAGEASGDQLGAKLAAQLKLQDPSLIIHGMGSSEMKAAGVNIILNAEKLSIIGGLQVITHFYKIFRAFSCIKNAIKKELPQLITLIDYPGFNLRIAQYAKKLNIPVLYYVSPQIWAWHYSRINKIRKNVDHMVVFFPFEEKMYQQENVPVTLVKHPILDRLSSTPTVKDYSSFKLNKNHPVIALIPGSRREEIKKILPVMMEAKEYIRRKIPHAQFVLPLSSHLDTKDVISYLTPDILIFRNKFHELLSHCSAAMVTSGTATLEVALHRVPLVITYKVFGYQFAKQFIIKTPYIGLCNIVAEEEVAKEMIQQQAIPIALANEIIALISNESYRSKRLKQLEKIEEKMNQGKPVEAVADIALAMMGERGQVPTCCN